MASQLVAEVLGAMITPAVLISAGGTLVLSTSNRLGRVVDRVRSVAHDAERLEQSQEATVSERKRTLIGSQLRNLSRRAILLRAAIASLYMAIGFLVATSLGVGLITSFDLNLAWVPIFLGMLGACGLLWGTVLLVREARLAIGATLEEMRYVDELLREPASSARDPHVRRRAKSWRMRS